MSERQNRAFYGEDGRPPLCAVMANLYELTGSEACARELVKAADYVEWVCGPTAALTAMPAWVC
jgi:hypothetical protein